MSAGTLEYRMQTCRAVIGDDSESFVEQLSQIEQSLTQYPALVFVVAKGFLDSVCKTVLNDLGVAVNPKWDTPRLVKEATNRLEMVSPTYAAAPQATDALARISGGLTTLVGGICDLRNNHSPASHGQDADTERLDGRQALLVAQTVDVLAAYIYRTHRESIAKSPATRVYYGDHVDFNAEFDARNPAVVVSQHSFPASLVLYHLKRDAYRGELIAYMDGLKDIDEETTDE